MRLLLLSTILLLPLSAQLQAQAASKPGPHEPSRPSRVAPPKPDFKLTPLDKAIVVEQLGVTYPKGSLHKSGAAKIRLTNPNSYPILFHVRRERDALLVGDSWKVKLRENRILNQTREPFGSKITDYQLDPGQSVEVEAALYHKPLDHTVSVTFRKKDDRHTLSSQVVHERQEGS